MASYLDQILAQAMVGVCIGYGLPLPTGKRLFVDSGHADTADDTDHGLTPDQPLSTLDFAIGLCTANNGDVIFLAPGHAETIAAAAGADLDCAGITIIGLGNGDNRPTFTFAGNVGADIDFDAAGIKVFNCKFVGSEDGLTGPLDINAANCGVYGCTFYDDGAENVVDWIVLDANADHFACVDCIHLGTDTAGNDSFITMNAADHVRIVRLQCNGDFAVACIDGSPGACTDLLITECHLENANAVDVCIELVAATTGWVSRNFCRIATDGQLTALHTMGSTSLFENYQVNNNAETGVLCGTPSA